MWKELLCDWGLPLVFVAVAIYMCKKYPTGVGGDPFPYEQGRGQADKLPTKSTRATRTLRRRES